MEPKAVCCSSGNYFLKAFSWVDGRTHITEGNSLYSESTDLNVNLMEADVWPQTGYPGYHSLAQLTQKIKPSQGTLIPSCSERSGHHWVVMHTKQLARDWITLTLCPTIVGRFDS